MARKTNTPTIIDVTPVKVDEKTLQVPYAPVDEDIQRSITDFNTARENLLSLAQKGSDALEEAIDFASQSQAPRAFEVVANLINTLTNTNKEILNLNKMLRDIKKDSPSAPPTEGANITNNTLILTAADLLDQIEEMDGED